MENFLEEGLSQLTPKAVKQVHYATSHYATALHRSAAPVPRLCFAWLPLSVALAATMVGGVLVCSALGSSDTVYVPVTAIR